MHSRYEHDARVRLYGSQKNIDATIKVLHASIPNLNELSEVDARLKIQDSIESDKLKTDILFDGNTVWDKTKIIRGIKKVKKNGMEAMTDYLYKFLSLACGSIAHYNKMGWVQEYPTIGHLKAFFRNNEFGQSVKKYMPYWKTDAVKTVEAIEVLLDI